MRAAVKGSVLGAAVFLALASPAVGQDTSLEGYGGQGGPPLITTGPPPTTPTPRARTSDDEFLPVTGFDLLLATGGGLLMLGVGLTLRRMARGPDIA